MDGSSCTVDENDGGVQTISCTDGTTVTVRGESHGAVCPDGLLVGSYAINNTFDSNLIRDCTTITGTLSVASGLATASVPALQEVGSLTMVGDSASLPELAIVRGALYISGGVTARLPKVQEVQGALTISGGSTLTTLALPALARVVGRLAIEADQLADIDLTSLKHAGDIYARAGSVFKELQLPALEDVGSLSGDAGIRFAFPELLTLAGEIVSYSAAIESLTAPKVTSIGTLRTDFVAINYPSLMHIDTLALDGPYSNRTMLVNLPALATADIIGLNNTSVTSLDLPNLTTAGTLAIAWNSKLTTLAMPVFASVQTLQVRNNSKLPTCRVNQIVAQLSSPPQNPPQISGNDNAAVCN